MLDWSYDDEGASASMPGIDSPTFFVNHALVGYGYVAMAFYPNGKRQTMPVPSLGDGISWCNGVAQHCVNQTACTCRICGTPLADHVDGVPCP